MHFLFIRKLFPLVVFFLLAGSSFAQDNDTSLTASDAVNTDAGTPASVSTIDYSAVDNYVLGLKRHYKKLPDLAKDLTAPYKTDDDKVRAIFMWITNNIAYDCAGFHSNKDMNIRFTYKSQADLDEQRKAYYLNYATRILRNKRAICEGYSVLFQELCNESGIPCEVVIGRVSNNTSMIARVRGKKNFSTNHAWNKVKVNGEWYFLDATWASGYCDKPVKKFYKSFKPYYYLTPPDKLYVTHAENEKQTEKRNNVVAKLK